MHAVLLPSSSTRRRAGVRSGESVNEDVRDEAKSGRNVDDNGDHHRHRGGGSVGRGDGGGGDRLEAVQSAVLLAMSDWGQDQLDRAWFMSCQSTFLHHVLLISTFQVSVRVGTGC